MMKNIKTLSMEELTKVKGGTYYGNGVSCTKSGCKVNWGQAWTCGGNHVSNGGHGSC